MNYLQKKKLAFMSIVNKVKGFVRTLIGIPPLTLSNCVDEDSLISYKIYGDSIQNGTPAPDAPVEIESVGEYDASTEKYKIPVRARGKNLLQYPYTETTQEDKGLTFIDNGDGSITVSGVPTGSSQFIFGTIPITGGKKYTLYRIAENESNIRWYWTFFDADGTKITEASTLNQIHTLTAPDNAATIKLLVFRGSVGVETSGTIYPMLLEGAITQADYEPYVEPITTNIYLDEPLRKIGDYADCVDFENGKVIRNIKSINAEANGWSSYNDGDEKHATKVYRLPIATLVNNYGYHCVCNRFIGKTRMHIYNGIKGIAANDLQIRLYYVGITDISIEDFQDWVSENPISVDYILSEPIEEDIELPKLPTFKGTTIYEVDTNIQPSNMEVSYYSSQKGE